MSVLRIDSSARLEGSNSRVLTQYLVEQMGLPVIERDLSKDPLPAISAEDLVDMHSSSDLPRDSLRMHSDLSGILTDELKSADDIIIGVAMYNFGIPTVLKQWVDYVCRAGITFKYGETGPIGLSGIKRAFIVTATGGTPIGSSMDFASTYLEFICRFIGVEEVIHIDAGGSKRTPDLVIEEGKKQIDKVLANS